RKWSVRQQRLLHVRVRSAGPPDHRRNIESRCVSNQSGTATTQRRRPPANRLQQVSVFRALLTAPFDKELSQVLFARPTYQVRLIHPINNTGSRPIRRASDRSRL